MTIRPVIKNGRQQWRVAWSQDGNERRKFFTTKGKAEAFSRTIEPASPTYARWLLLTQAEQLDALEAAKLSRQAGHSVTEAVRHYHQTAENLTTPITLAKAWQQFYAIKQDHQGVRPSTLKALRHQIKSFTDAHPALVVGEITAEHLSQWIAAHNWSPVSRNAFLTCARTFFGWCQSKRYTARLPTDGIPRAITPERVVEILAVDQASALMRAAERVDRRLAPYIAAGLFAGVRPTEQTRLRPVDIDLARGVINLTGQHTKTRRSRLVHLTDNAKTWLALDCDWPPVNLRRRILAVREAADLTAWPQDVLRHSFASYYLASYGLASCAMESGNSEEVLLKHYRHPVTRSEAAKFFGIMPGKQSDNKSQIKLAQGIGRV